MAQPAPLIAASVIIASRHRAQALARCITALRHQDHPQFEVIVVADPAAIAQLQGQTDLKLIPFDRANISQARNLGLNAAAGAAVLFIDDDAVPEPNWASRLTAAFDTPSVVAATGFVRGRNGISYQWRASQVDQLGQDHPLDVPDHPSIHTGSQSRAVKTQGTNCAFRTDMLRAIGGFDPAFAFYLDEADVNLRLAPFGQTAIVPSAQVHHGFLASARRQANRAPSSLYDIAASTAAFLRKHAPAADFTAAMQQLQAAQSTRLARFVRARRLGQADVAPLMRSLDDGWQAGLVAAIGTQPLPASAPPFRPLASTGPRPSTVIAGYSWNAAQLHRRAAAARDAGQIVTVICLSLGVRRHSLQFLPDGYWWQSGGIWGRSDRDKPPPLGIRFAARVAREAARLSGFRPNTPQNYKTSVQKSAEL